MNKRVLPAGLLESAVFVAFPFRPDRTLSYMYIRGCSTIKRTRQLFMAQTWLVPQSTPSRQKSKWQRGPSAPRTPGTHSVVCLPASLQMHGQLLLKASLCLGTVCLQNPLNMNDTIRTFLRALQTSWHLQCESDASSCRTLCSWESARWVCF